MDHPQVARISAALDRLVNGVQERDREVARAAVEAAAPAIAQAAAESTVKALSQAGWLLEKPATHATVKEVLRDPAGRIEAIVETVAQIERPGSTEPAAPAGSEPEPGP